MRGALKQLLLAALAFVSMGTALYLYAPIGWGPFQQNPGSGCDGGNGTDPFCTCTNTIEGGSCDGEIGSVWWSTWCQDTNEDDVIDECVAVTECSNGNQKTCDGDYRAAADHTGVTCKDTGSDPGETDLCET